MQRILYDRLRANDTRQRLSIGRRSSFLAGPLAVKFIAAHLFHSATHLFMLLPELAKADKLFLREDSPDRELVHITEPRQFRLREFDLFQAKLDVRLVQLIGVNGRVESARRFMQPLHSLAHQRPFLGVEFAYLLNLLVEKPELVKQASMISAQMIRGLTLFCRRRHFRRSGFLRRNRVDCY
jgi:hypothetical protein